MFFNKSTGRLVEVLNLHVSPAVAKLCIMYTFSSTIYIFLTEKQRDITCVLQFRLRLFIWEEIQVWLCSLNLDNLKE
jgi:hypothetical protein